METMYNNPVLGIVFAAWFIGGIISTVLFWYGKVPGSFWGDKAEDGGPAGMMFVAAFFVVWPFFIVFSIVAGLINVVRSRPSRKRS